MFSHRFVNGLALAIVVIFAAACAPGPSSTASLPAAAAPARASAVDSIAAAPTATAAAPTAAPATATVLAPATSAVTTSNDNSTITLQIVPAKSNAQYRVREQLASLSLPSDAIGKTQEITGTIAGRSDGTIDSSQSKFVVNVASLQSDRSQRDNFLRGNVLQTNQYPNVVFVPRQQTGAVFPLPASGDVTFKLTGDLTIRNVTKPVTWQVNCQGQGSEGLCHATTSFTFEDFNLTQPRVPVVLSVVDNITLELDAYLQRVGN
jgi:polyisoprenoid-binding protein YceI